jgi:ADP-ribose diphosphatase
MEPWQRIEPTIVTKIDYHNVIIKTFRTPDGSMATRATFQAEDRRSVGVIAITRDNKIIIARQFRPGPESIFDEIPGGYVDIGEDPEAAGRRELLEETGYAAGNMFLLGQYNPGSYSNGISYYYLATECELTNAQALDQDEFIHVELRSIQEFIDIAKRGDMSDPYAVLAAYDQLMEIQKKEIL